MTKARPCENAAFLCPVRMRTRFAHAWGVFTLSFVLAKSFAPCVAAVPPVAPVKVGGAIGERFQLTVRGNFMQLELEKDFFRPFEERKSKGAFIGLGKLALYAYVLPRTGHRGGRHGRG